MGDGRIYQIFERFSERYKDQSYGIFPGGMDTNIFDNVGKKNYHSLPWMMKKEDVADIIVFALTRPDDILMERIVVTKME